MIAESNQENADVRLVRTIDVTLEQACHLDIRWKNVKTKTQVSKSGFYSPILRHKENFQNLYFKKEILEVRKKFLI